MDISEVNIQLIKPRNSLIGYASLVINRELYVSTIAIHRQLAGPLKWRILYPAQKINGEYLFYFKPIEREAGEEIYKAVTDRLEEILANKNIKF